MKRISLLIIALLAFSMGVSAQSKTKVAYHGRGLTIKGTKGFKLKVSNTYTLDGVAFAPTFDASQATLDNQPFEIKPNIAFTNLQTTCQATSLSGGALSFISIMLKTRSTSSICSSTIALMTT